MDFGRSWDVGRYCNDMGNPYLKKPAKRTYTLPRLYIENPLTNPEEKNHVKSSLE
jgi:hypothetical protein